MQFYCEKEFKEKSYQKILKKVQQLKIQETDDLLLLDNLKRFTFENQETQKECLEFIGKEILIENGINFILISYKSILDDQNNFLIQNYIEQMRQRVEIFMKKAQKNYDFTIMLCPQNVEDKNSEKLTNWILNFIFQFEQNILNLKCQINLQFKNSIQYISSHLKIDSKQLIIMERQFNLFKEFTQAPEVNIQIFQHYFKKAKQDLQQALDYYFVDAQLGKVYKPIDNISKEQNFFSILQQAQIQSDSKRQKKVTKRRSKKEVNKKIKQPIKTDSSVFQMIEQTEIYQPLLNIPQQQNVDQNATTSKKYKSEYEQFLEQRKASKNKRVTALDIENNKSKFEQFKHVYLKIGTQTKILAIKDIPEFDSGRTRLNSQDKLNVRLVVKPSYEGVSRKLLKKNKDLRGSVKIEYKYYNRVLELVNLVFLEKEIFDLLQQGLIKIKANIIDYDHSYEKDYTFEIHYYVRIDAFNNNNKELQKILIDKKSHKKYTDKRKAMLDLFEYLQLTESISNHELDKKGQMFLKQKFYEQTSNKKNQQNFTDFTPKDITLQLYEFQKYGLYWMVQRESPALEEINEQNSDIHPMWKELCVDFELKSSKQNEDIIKNFLISQNQKNFTISDKWYFYFNILSGDISLNFPFFDIQNTFGGGILADEMGLGKTIMMLSLISFSLQKENKTHQISMRENYLLQKKRKAQLQNKLKQNIIPFKKDQTKFANNLIVMPAILIQQWKQQIQKIISTKLKVFLYKDVDKKKKIDLSKYDIVLTSYEQVRQDLIQEQYAKNLFQFTWTRIILDEANRIRNTKSLNSQSIFQLQGVSKWCVTGTPLENSIQDLYSLIKFLNYEPWSDQYWWKEYIQNPLQKDKNVQALDVLIKITKPIILRRSKKFNADILKLQEIQHQEVLIEMSEDEYQTYQKKQIKSKQELEENMVGYKKSPFHIYEIILRLRQICNHSRLPRISKHEFNVDQTANGFINKMLERQDKRAEENYENNGVTFKIEYITQKINEFKEGKTNLCVICMEDFTEPVLTFCQHFFCKFCLYQNLEITSPECPLCKTQLSKKDVYKIQEYFKKSKLQLQKCEIIYKNGETT